MKILHLETSSRNCSVAISEGRELLCLCEEISDGHQQSEKLHRFVEWALEAAEISLQDLDAVALSQGPGSYTGLRIGAASAKGFCFALEIPMIAVDTMLTLVQPFENQGFDYIVPLIDARRMEVYTAIYDGKTGTEIQGATNIILDENSFAELENRKILFVGDGAKKASEVLKVKAEFQPEVFPSAEFMVRAASQKFEKKDFVDVAYFEPFYLKEFQGVKKAKK
ncbi:tRNA (adenosine(37)-N6)-threonylcarbamoyltransferase complex dimerization subunit type 1 TsaB [Cruoricaptor ignavus]|uniref:tRNA (adenosine(37)-N6)-threonylcarbamoyltransferase complex dimerization subunit type 1 TsaB n=1 Tax=Cruoricaptor ignavus TaxID=1118202 RepID=UPI00370DA20C